MLPATYTGDLYDEAGGIALCPLSSQSGVQTSTWELTENQMCRPGTAMMCLTATLTLFT